MQQFPPEQFLCVYLWQMKVNSALEKSSSYDAGTVSLPMARIALHVRH
jgi:hypothetical protein